MSEIIAYFNTFLNLIFNQAGTSNKLELLRTSQVIGSLKNHFDLAAASSPFDIGRFLFSVVSDSSLLFSLFVWSWFAVLIVNLLLIWPFNWIRSVIRKCKI